MIFQGVNEVVFSLKCFYYRNFLDGVHSIQKVPEGLRKVFKQEWDFLYKTTPLGEWKDIQRMGSTSTTRNLKKVAQRMRDIWPQYKMATRQSGIVLVCFLPSSTLTASVLLLVQSSATMSIIFVKYETVLRILVRPNLLMSISRTIWEMW